MLPRVFQSKVCKTPKPATTPTHVDATILGLIHRDLIELKSKQGALEKRVDVQDRDMKELSRDLDECSAQVEMVAVEQDNMREDLMGEQLEIETDLRDKLSSQKKKCDEAEAALARLTTAVDKLDKEPNPELKGVMFRLRSIEQAMDDAQCSELSTEDTIAELNAHIDDRCSEIEDMCAKIRAQQLQPQQPRSDPMAASIETRLRDVFHRLQYLEDKALAEEKKLFQVYRKS